MNQLDYLFTPKSVAVIGASRSPKKAGHVIFRNFIDEDFKGMIYPINPNIDEMFGYKCYPSVLKVKGEIELAVLAVPAALVPKALEECGRKRIPAAIIISSGFKEIGKHNLENKIKEIVNKYNIRVLGPNCLGVYNPYSGVDTIFNPRYKLERPEEGHIAFISQSGATMSVILDWITMKGYRASKFISYGNAADIDEAELIEYLTKDKQTSVICVYLEGVKNGRRFFNALKNSSKKPIIVLKGGETKAGSRAVTSHTGSLAGEAEVYEAAFKQTGTVISRDLEQIFDFARVLSTQPKPKGRRVQIITDGGGFGVLTVDWLIKNGFEIAKMKKESIQKLRKIMPSYIILGNPIDLTGNVTTEMYRASMEAALNDNNIDAIILIILFYPPNLTSDVVEAVIEESKRKKKPILVISAGGRYTEVLKKFLEDDGVPCFSYPERAIHALKALHDYSKTNP